MLSRFIVAAALGITLVASAAGCGAAGPAGGPGAADVSPAAPTGPKPTEVLAAAVTKTTGVSLKLTLAGDTAEENVAGSYDAPHGIGSIAQTAGADRMTVTVTADDLYLAGLSDFNGKTMHLKITKIDAKSPIVMFTDLLAPLTMLSGVTDATATGPGSFAGTLDLTKARSTTAGSKKFLDFVVAAAAAKAVAVRFTATVDAQGYLTGFKATLPAIDEGKDGEYDVTFSDFGAALTLTKPSGSKVIEAPAALYGR
ncbi:hypothetical protein Dvina_41130 [Dactylosporangium vinaceum]|uniref:Lipoprotein n=1 Tax=Dactylosporangium vinaceum TaxID=53362 RepID=A0ABV5MPW8_9ACTN|nr:hypothetical protein [Dactylosporangium vinaceum]UAB94485.1 hypothetical protein Dvina_41130 [Dactylosporangium vinaceum]